MLKFDFSEKGLGLVSPPQFVYDFFNKNVAHDIFYELTKFSCLIAFTSRDIVQYLYSNWVNVTEIKRSYCSFFFHAKKHFKKFGFTRNSVLTDSFY